MAQASAKYAFLKVRDMWGAKSPEEERLVAIIAELKGKLKLAPELARKKKDLIGKKDKKTGEARFKNKKKTTNKHNQKQEEAWKKTPPKDGEPKEKISKARPTIGVNTTWPGEFTPQRTAASGRPARREISLQRRKSSPTPLMPLLPPPQSLARQLPASSPTSRWRRLTNDGATQHGGGAYSSSRTWPYPILTQDGSASSFSF